MNFYPWLQSRPDKYAFLLNAFHTLRIPKTANKLHVLLRHAQHAQALRYTLRKHLKDAHREWRKGVKYIDPHRKRAVAIHELTQMLEPQFTEVAELQNVEIPRLISPDFDSQYLPGLKRGEDITFTANFQLSEESADDLFLRLLDTMSIWLVKSVEGLPPVKSEQWRRVYRRWGFKHRDKCAVCQRTNFFGTRQNSICARPECELLADINIHEQD